MITRICLSIFALLFAPLLPAGFTQPAPVEVTINQDGSGSASGDMVTARFADNDVELIGCGIRAFFLPDGTNYQTGFCQARDADEASGVCYTDNAVLLDALKAGADYSFITFEWDENEECTRIGFSTQSFYIPEHTDKKGKDK